MWCGLVQHVLGTSECTWGSDGQLQLVGEARETCWASGTWGRGRQSKLGPHLSPTHFAVAVRRREAKLLFGMLPAYYRHMSSHPHTLLTKFYGLHRITTASGRQVGVCWFAPRAFRCMCQCSWYGAGVGVHLFLLHVWTPGGRNTCSPSQSHPSAFFSRWVSRHVCIL